MQKTLQTLLSALGRELAILVAAIVLGFGLAALAGWLVTTPAGPAVVAVAIVAQANRAPILTPAPIPARSATTLDYDELILAALLGQEVY